MSDFFTKIISEKENYCIIIDCDGKVAYAYLLHNKKIVSDVWLYNQQETPATINWKDTSQMPFLNPRQYAKEVNVSPITSDKQIKIKTFTENGLTGAMLYFDGKLFAKLLEGSKPGWSLLAKKDGPLAKKL